ncbi:HNH endonuclease [Arthrobacter phage Giantsbane]|nr:HNH endonuclease [Arthrobacter phage Giantsbane]
MVSEQESWVVMSDFPNYMVSNHGRVINTQYNRQLTPRPNDKGYLRVTLCHEGKCREFYIHKLVAFCFFNFPLEDQVIHYDGDTTNNSVSNLYLRKRVRQITSARPLEGSETEEFRRQWGKRVRIVETGEVFRTVRDCASYINGDYSSIYAVLRGHRDSHRGFTYEYH